MFDLLGALHLFDDHRLVPVPHHECAGLAGAPGEFLQLGLCHAAHVEVRQQGTGQCDQPETQPEPAGAVVALDVTGLLQRGKDPGHAALVEVHFPCDLGDSQYGLCDRE